MTVPRCQLCLLLLLAVPGESLPSRWRKLHRSNGGRRESASCYVLMVFNLCFTAPRGNWGENHRRLRGAALLHQAPGLPPLLELPLLRRHPHPPAVGGVCCPLLETVSGCTRAVTWPQKACDSDLCCFILDELFCSPSLVVVAIRPSLWSSPWCTNWTKKVCPRIKRTCFGLFFYISSKQAKHLSWWKTITFSSVAPCVWWTNGSPTVSKFESRRINDIIIVLIN